MGKLVFKIPRVRASGMNRACLHEFLKRSVDYRKRVQACLSRLFAFHDMLLHDSFCHRENPNGENGMIDAHRRSYAG